jgi:hypothetical protein
MHQRYNDVDNFLVRNKYAAKVRYFLNIPNTPNKIEENITNNTQETTDIEVIENEVVEESNTI